MRHWNCVSCKLNVSSSADVGPVECPRCEATFFLDGDALVAEHRWIIEYRLNPGARWRNILRRQEIEEIFGEQIDRFRPISFRTSAEAFACLTAGLELRKAHGFDMKKDPIKTCRLIYLPTGLTIGPDTFEGVSDFYEAAVAPPPPQLLAPKKPRKPRGLRKKKDVTPAKEQVLS